MWYNIFKRNLIAFVGPVNRYLSNLFSYKMAKIFFLEDWNARRHNKMSKMGINGKSNSEVISKL